MSYGNHRLARNHPNFAPPSRGPADVRIRLDNIPIAGVMQRQAIYRQYAVAGSKPGIRQLRIGFDSVNAHAAIFERGLQSVDIGSAPNHQVRRNRDHHHGKRRCDKIHPPWRMPGLCVSDFHLGSRIV